MDKEFEESTNAGLRLDWNREVQNAAAVRARRIAEANANAVARNAESTALTERRVVREDVVMVEGGEGLGGEEDGQEEEGEANQRAGQNSDADKQGLTLGYLDIQAEAGGKPEDTSLEELDELMEGY